MVKFRMEDKKRNQVTQGFLETSTKDEVIKLVTDKINNLDDVSLIGFVKEFDWKNTDGYKTLQFTIQEPTKEYLDKTITSLQTDLENYKKDLVVVKEEIETDKADIAELISECQVEYDIIQGSKDKFITAMNVVGKEMELDQKVAKLEYKETYIKNTKDSLDYHISVNK